MTGTTVAVQGQLPYSTTVVASAWAGPEHASHPCEVPIRIRVPISLFRASIPSFACTSAVSLAEFEWQAAHRILPSPLQVLLEQKTTHDTAQVQTLVSHDVETHILYSICGLRHRHWFRG